MDDDASIAAAVPVVATDDVLETVRYFEETLGFERQWTWGDPLVYAGLRAGSALLYIGYDPDLAFTIDQKDLTPEIFFWVNGIENVYQRHRAAGAEILEELSERRWGTSQYVVAEPNGYRLKIAEDMSS